MEVDTSWLEPAEEDAPKQGRRPSTEMRRPSRKMQAAVPPPMPAGPGGPPPAGPPRRETMEVDTSWLELDDGTPAHAARRSVVDARAVRPSRTNVPTAPVPEKAMRQPWEPPPLPPPPANAARARRALPPPLPRGEEDAPSPAPAKRDSRRPPRR